MGTENDLDVEGQTEPPICGFKSSVACTPSPTLAGTFGIVDGDVTDATVGRGSIVSTVDTVDTVRAFTPESAHTLSVPDVSGLLGTDFEYASRIALFALTSMIPLPR